MKLTIKEIQKIETEIIGEVATICANKDIDYFLHCGTVLGAIRHGGPIPWDTDADIVVPNNQYERFIKIMREHLSDKFYVDYYDRQECYPIRFARIGLKGYSTQILHVDIFQLIGTANSKIEQIKHHKEAAKLIQILYNKTFSEKYRGKVSLRKKIRVYLYKIRFLRYSKVKANLKFDDLCNRYPYEQSKFVTNPNGHYGMKNVLPKSIYGKGVFYDYAGIKAKIPQQYEEYLKNYYSDYMQLPPKKERFIEDYYIINRIKK